MPNLDDLALLHQIDEKRVELFGILQGMVVEDVANVSESELDNGDTSLFVFCSCRPKLTIEADELS